MAILEPVVAQLIIHGLTRPKKSHRHRKAGLMLIAASGLLSLIGVVYLFIALSAWLSGIFGPAAGPLLTGIAALALGGLATAGFRMLESRDPKRPKRDAMEDTGEALYSAVEKATRGLEEPIASHPKAAVLMASMAGYMAANKLH